MRRNRGVILLEAAVALMIVAVAAVAFLRLSSESVGMMRRTREADEESRAAERFFGVATLWTAADLDRRLGSRRQGPWTLTIQRERPHLYSLTLLDSLAGRVILTTAVYRPEEPGR